MKTYLILIGVQGDVAKYWKFDAFSYPALAGASKAFCFKFAVEHCIKHIGKNLRPLRSLGFSVLENDALYKHITSLLRLKELLENKYQDLVALEYGKQLDKNGYYEIVEITFTWMMTLTESWDHKGELDHKELYSVCTRALHEISDLLDIHTDSLEPEKVLSVMKSWKEAQKK